MANPGNYRVGLFQFAPRLGDRRANLEAIEAGLEGAEAELFVLPELATSGYALQERQAALAIAERPEGSEGLERLQALAERKDAALVVGLPLHEGDKLFNASALLRPGRDPVFYRKLHLFYRERELFEPGDRPPEVHEHRGLGIGVMICFDWVFPETARLLALAGADLIAHPSNLVLPGFAQAAMVTRSVENGVFSVTCNRVGEESYTDEAKPLRFTGLSQLLDTRGERRIRFDEVETRCAVVEIDPAAAADKMLTPRNHLIEDRRVDFYGELTAGNDEGGNHDA